MRLLLSPELDDQNRTDSPRKLNYYRDMPQRKRKKHRAGELIRKIRKPIPPPSRTIDDPTKYKRERELERLRREEKSGNS